MIAAAFDSDDDCEGDGEQEQEALGDLIDDNSIQEDGSFPKSDDETSGCTERKRDANDELDDRDGELPRFQILKPKVMGLYEELKKYQLEKNPKNMRVLTDVGFESVVSMKELSDVYNHLILHYENVLPAIMSIDDDDLKNLRDLGNVDLKLYCDIADTALGTFVKEYYGLIPMQLGENMREKLQLNEVRQIEKLPRVAAFDYVSTAEVETKFSDFEEVLDAANYMLAAQIAGEPLVRRCARKSFFEDAYIHVILTEQSMKEIDGNQPSCKTLN